MQGVKIRTVKPKLPPAAIVNFLGQIRNGLIALTRKIVPIEQAAPTPGISHVSKFLDLGRLAATTVRERIKEEYRALTTNTSFYLERITPTQVPASAFFEVISI